MTTAQKPEGYFTTTEDGRWVEAPEGADRSRLTPLYGEASLVAKEAECEALRERLAFLTQPGALRFVEEESGMYRAYEDKAPADAEQHFWQSMTTLYYPSAAEAIDAARAAADQGGAS